MVAPLKRVEVTQALTTLPWTRNYRHLLPVPRHWLVRKTRFDPHTKAVRPQDRIKHWNIVPGDRIRLRGDRKNTLHEVLSINRFSNRVYLKGTTSTDNPQDVPTTKNYHYSRCQLFVGEYEFPRTETSPRRVLPVFAKRIGTGGMRWDKLRHRYTWDRFATQLEPEVPYVDTKVPVEWPKPEKPQAPEASSYDTLEEDLVEVTYTPPAFSLSGPVPRPPLEKEYLLSFFRPELADNFGQAPPVEVYLEKELSNPHSRAKKQARWQAYSGYKRALLVQLMEEEVQNSPGLSKGEARAQAVWRWREQLETERKAEKNRKRWKNVQTVAKVSRKKAQKVKREDRKRKQLAELVLKPEPNQVIPPNMHV